MTQFGPGNQIGRVSQLPALPTELRKTYAKFKREAQYFAAFAVNFETQDGFYIQNFHDAGRVRAAALEGCRQLSGQSGCKIYAVTMPRGLPVGQSKSSGLSLSAHTDFNTRYQDHRKPGTYAAFAVSCASHHGFGNAYAAKHRHSVLQYRRCQRYGRARARSPKICHIPELAGLPRC